MYSSQRGMITNVLFIISKIYITLDNINTNQSNDIHFQVEGNILKAEM